jgi:hypothetical protein
MNKMPVGARAGISLRGLNFCWQRASRCDGCNHLRTLRRERNSLRPRYCALFETCRTLGACRHDFSLQHGIYRQHCRERGVTGAASKPQRYHRGRAVGHRGVLAPVSGAPPGWRIAGRSLWTAPGFPIGHCGFRPRVCMVRVRIRHKTTDRRARGAGIWRGPTGSRQSCYH